MQVLLEHRTDFKPGGIDKFTIVMSEPYICAEKEDKQRPKTEIGEYGTREVAPSSMDLAEGMSIKAETGEKVLGEKDNEQEI